LSPGRALASELVESKDKAGALSGRLRTADATARNAVDEAEAVADQRAAELDQRERDLGVREAAVTAVEQQIAADSIREGTWTVGVDVAPGTYRTEAAVTGRCYWAITRSGTNGSDIVQNDNVSGGFPTVTLREGQDFENSRCGTFIKQ
jgi:hypothetical protein